MSAEDDYRPSFNSRLAPWDAITQAAHEARVVLVIARAIARGYPMRPEDAERLELAKQRLEAALDLPAEADASVVKH